MKSDHWSVKSANENDDDLVIDDTQISDQWYNESTDSDIAYDNDINIGDIFTTTGSGQITTNCIPVVLQINFKFKFYYYRKSIFKHFCFLKFVMGVIEVCRPPDGCRYLMVRCRYFMAGCRYFMVSCRYFMVSHFMTLCQNK